MMSLGLNQVQEISQRHEQNLELKPPVYLWAKQHAGSGYSKWGKIDGPFFNWRDASRARDVYEETGAPIFTDDRGRTFVDRHYLHLSDKSPVDRWGRYKTRDLAELFSQPGHGDYVWVPGRDPNLRRRRRYKTGRDADRDAPMKRRELLRKLEDCGARFSREGGSHEIYTSPTGGLLVVPRHTDISPGVTRKLLREGCGSSRRDKSSHGAKGIMVRKSRTVSLVRRIPDELEAGRRTGPNRYTFSTKQEAIIFTHNLRAHGHRADRQGIIVEATAPQSAIEWADANAFKYGSRVAAPRSRGGRVRRSDIRRVKTEGTRTRSQNREAGKIKTSRSGIPYKVCGHGTRIQTLLFPVDLFTEAQAVKWAHDNGFRVQKVDVTKNYVRIRQQPVDLFVKGSFRTIALGKRGRIRSVIGCPRFAILKGKGERALPRLERGRVAADF